MVNAVNNGEPPPPELVLAWDCERYKALPDSGGVLDQDYALMRRMVSLSSLHSAYSAYREAKGAAIHNLPRWVLANIAYLRDMGIGVGLDG